MNSKSQAAIEFLTTYGWAFLMMLVVIAAVTYFGVLRPQKLLPDRCSFNLAFECIGYKITGGSSGALNLRLQNNGGHTITVNGINLSTQSAFSFTCSGPPANPVNWQAGESKDLQWTGCNADSAGLVSGDKGKILIRLNYYDINAGVSYSQIADGEIYSTVS